MNKIMLWMSCYLLIFNSLSRKVSLVSQSLCNMNILNMQLKRGLDHCKKPKKAKNIWNSLLVSCCVFSHTNAMALGMAISVWRLASPPLWCRYFHQRMKPNNIDDPVTFPLAPLWGSHSCFLVKCLDNYWMDCRYILYRYSCPPQD